VKSQLTIATPPNLADESKYAEMSANR